MGAGSVLDRLGIYDNFFDLDGHSLAATRRLPVIKQFQIEKPLQFLFQSLTIAEIMIVMSEHQTRKPGKGELDRIIAELEWLSDERSEAACG